MFTLPDVPDAPQEGSSEEHPLFLETIKADELREFLRVLSSRPVELWRRFCELGDTDNRVCSTGGF